MNVKELFENKELMNSIVEDIEDIPEDSEVSYCVWGICYDEDDDCIDSYFIREFVDPDEAVEYAKGLTPEVFNAEYEKPDSNTVRLALEVETVVADPEDDDCTMNVGTVYQRDLWIDGEYGSENDFDPTVEITEADYTLLDDGTLKVSCKLLKDFNKNDYVRFYFVDEPDYTPLYYKIMAKVIYADGDYYHCEIQF
jgi:hypothetical protein